jgi:hypothetical protein
MDTADNHYLPAFLNVPGYHALFPDLNRAVKIHKL